MRNDCLNYSEIERNTLETKIKMSLNMDETIRSGLIGTTGIGFFDHMLNSFAIHSEMQISLEMQGDINVDCHHTIEDVGIVLGKIIGNIAQNRKPLKRYGMSYIPMDEALARTVIDISNRPYLVFDYTPKAQMIGNFDTQMVEEFFRAVSFNMGATVHIALLYGQNDHHAVEAIFKSFAHALKEAMQQKNGNELSAKGQL